MNKIKRTILFVLVVTMGSGCSRSVVYSPSINLPNKILAKNEIDVQAGIELLPEARPEVLMGNQTTLGINGQLSYGFGDKFNLSVKSWADIEGRENVVRSGFSLNAQFIKNIDEQSRLILLPRFGIALNAADIVGYGLGSSVLYHRTLKEKLSWYGGVGAAWGFRYLEKDLDAEMNEELPMGLGLIGNLGIGWELATNFRLNAELNPIYQINTFENNSQFLVSPTIGLGYTFRKAEGK